jgi:hypothetical protein
VSIFSETAINPNKKIAAIKQPTKWTGSVAGDTWLSGLNVCPHPGQSFAVVETSRAQEGHGNKLMTFYKK